MGELQSYQHFHVKRTEPTLALQVQILKPTTIPRLLCFLIGILIFADYQNWAELCKLNIAWSYLVRGHGVSGGFPIRFAPWQNNKIHWRPICTFISGAVAIFYLPRIGQDDFLAGPCRWSAFRLFHGHQIGHVGQNCLQVRHRVAVGCWSGLARCFCNPVKGCKS